MRKIIIMSLLFVNLLGSTVKQEWYNLTTAQKTVIKSAYQFGLKYNYGLTLAAITVIESSGGKYRISTDFADVGVTQVNLYWFMKNNGIKNTLYSRSEWTTKLIRDDAACFKYSVDVLINFKRKYGTYRSAVSAYNNGKPVNTVYYAKVSKWVKFFNKSGVLND